MIEIEQPWHDAIKHCWAARDACQKTFFQHCLSEGGEHVERDHVLTMMDCIELCQTAADSMTRGSPVYAAICAAAASVAEACAESCDDLDTEEMRQLAAICRTCAASCREISLGGSGDATVSLQHEETAGILKN